MVSRGGDPGYRDWYGGGPWACSEKLGRPGGPVYVRIGELSLELLSNSLYILLVLSNQIMLIFITDVHQSFRSKGEN